MAGDEVTLGEVVRILMKQDVMLHEIRDEVRKTNGTVGRHETRLTVLEDWRKSHPEEPQRSSRRTGLTISLSGAGAVGAWELIRKLAGW